MKIRPQYHFRKSNQRLLAWDVNKLCQRSLMLEPKEVRVSEIRELDQCFWYDLGGCKPTCRNIVEHVKLINKVDANCPIILDKDGHVMDGMHRVCRALLENKQTILAVQFEYDIPADYVDISPDDLAYEV